MPKPPAFKYREQYHGIYFNLTERDVWVFDEAPSDGSYWGDHFTAIESTVINDKTLPIENRAEVMRKVIRRYFGLAEPQVLPGMSRSLPPFQRHSDTSREAAVRMYEKAPTIRRKVYEFIYSRGKAGATAAEVKAALGLRGSTVRPRIVELRQRGLVATTGRTRLTPSKRRASVNVATEFVDGGATTHDQPCHDDLEGDGT